MTLTVPSIAHLTVPPAPWDVSGAALIVMGRLPRRAARALAGVRNLISLPGIGSLAFFGLVRYDRTPVGDYHELIVCPGIHWHDLPGAFISQMVVDSPASWLAGRAIWSLPKELGRFDWRERDGLVAVAVRDSEDRTVMTVSARLGRRSPGILAPLVPIMAVRGPRRIIFGISGTLGQRREARVALDLPPGSALAPLAAVVRGPHVAWWTERLRLRITLGYDLF
jgi:hypothetical protein